MELVDVGVNLGHASFASDLDDVLVRAEAAGVARVVAIGTDVGESRRAVELARAHAGTIWATAGVHPHDAKTWTDDTAAIITELAGLPQVVAVGECGLDYNRDYSPRDQQRAAFAAQIAIATATRLPIYLHERDATDDMVAMLSERRDTLSKVLVHCFTGDRHTLQRYLDLDCYIGVTGWVCDERRGADLADAVSYIPADRLMVETDAPFLMPRTIRPKPKGKSARRNEPANLIWVVQRLAVLRDQSELEIAATTTAAAAAFFGFPACTS